jgi:A/G-specific adenine glycosylase
MNIDRFQKNLLNWYTDHHRKLPWRKTSDPYAVWVSEIMLQQTRVDTAIDYYLRFMDRFPTPTHLAEADIQVVLKMWEGLGYYSRARNLHRAAAIIVSQYDGKVPDNPELFLRLPGVGDYTCAAVMSIAFGRSLPVVDGNVKRVLARLMEMDTPVNQHNAHRVFKKPAAKLLCTDEPATFNQAIMELGALICTPKAPRCKDCPISDFCLAYKNHTTAEFPKRNPSKKVPHRHIFIVVIRKNEKMLVVQRPLEGFLGGLWEFPSIPGLSTPAQPGDITKRIKKETGLEIEVNGTLTRIKHAYTHFTLTGDIYLSRYIKGRIRLHTAQAHRWVTFGSLKRLPLHKATHKFLEPLAASLRLDKNANL